MALAKAGVVPSDVHMLGIGFTCSSCHDSKEVHAIGDYHTMKEAVKRDCTDCHEKGWAPVRSRLYPSTDSTSGICTVVHVTCPR